VRDPVQIVTDPRRREILRLVWEGERTAGDIAAHFDTTFGAVSQHLAVLRDAGYVDVRAEGNRRYYRANREALGPMVPVLEAMWRSVLDQLAQAVETDR
jgi:DNA-binding transcriptional ArsR family regulator